MAEPGKPLPSPLKTHIESLSGMDMSAVRVHYNSARPAQLGAQAYAQGADIHLGPGQAHRLAHEAWHVVQQRQGRVADGVRTHIGLATDADTLGVQRDLLAKGTPR